MIARCSAAEAKGVQIGMTLAQAKALCADVFHAEHDPQRDQRALYALGRWMMRFTPLISPAQFGDVVGLFLDITGCERVFGGIDNLVAQVHAALQSLGIAARLAIAPTPGAAWAFALSDAGSINLNGDNRIDGQCEDDSTAANRSVAANAIDVISLNANSTDADAIVIEPQQLRAALAPLSPATLRLSPQCVESLYHMGLTTIGQLMDLPRPLLPARFGAELLDRLDQATGELAEPLKTLEFHTPIIARMDFEALINSPETLWKALQILLERILEELTRRGAGARRIELTLLAPHVAPVVKTILLSRPSRNPLNLFRLLQCATEELQPTAGKSNRHKLAPMLQEEGWVSRGFASIVLSVPLWERVDDEQIALLAHEQNADQRELEGLVERLCIRMGTKRIARPELAESHVPEHATVENPGVDGEHSNAATPRQPKRPAAKKHRRIRTQARGAASRIANAASRTANTASGTANTASGTANAASGTANAASGTANAASGTANAASGTVNAKSDSAKTVIADSSVSRDAERSGANHLSLSHFHTFALSALAPLRVAANQNADDSITATDAWADDARPANRGWRLQSPPIRLPNFKCPDISNPIAANSIAADPNIIGNDSVLDQTSLPLQSVLPTNISVAQSARASLESAARPLFLLAEPARVRAMVSPSDDREGRPIAFFDSAGVHEVVHCVGPERIEGRWWHGHDKTRDYFDVEDTDGKRFWIFRVAQTGQWFVQGAFE